MLNNLLDLDRSRGVELVCFGYVRRAVTSIDPTDIANVIYNHVLSFDQMYQPLGTTNLSITSCKNSTLHVRVCKNHRKSIPKEQRIVSSIACFDKKSSQHASNINYNSSRHFISNDINLLQKINNENIAKIFNLNEYSTPEHSTIARMHVQVITQHCWNGELIEFVTYTCGIGSRVARTYFCQILNGLKAMNDIGYIHRNIKAHDLLLDENYQLKIAQGGFPDEEDENDDNNAYIPPQRGLGWQYEMFMIGTVLFKLLYGS